MLKHLPGKPLNKIKKTLLYSNKPLYYNRTTLEKWTFNSTTPDDITDLNIERRFNDFQYLLKNEHVYRVSLRYFCDIGKINFPFKIYFKMSSENRHELIV